MKLFKVETKGLGEFMVIADNVELAEKFVTRMFDGQNYGNSNDRRIKCINYIDEEPSGALSNCELPFLSDRSKTLLIVSNWPLVLKETK